MRGCVPRSGQALSGIWSVSPEHARDRLAGMVEDIDRIARFIDGRSRDEFVSDERTVFAVSYAFVRLGEAIQHLPESLLQQHPEVEWRDIRHFRNFMVHVYQAVDPARLYDTARSDLPWLRSKLEDVLRRV